MENMSLDVSQITTLKRFFADFFRIRPFGGRKIGCFIKMAKSVVFLTVKSSKC